MLTMFAAVAGFNGAAAFQPRKVEGVAKLIHWVPDMLQWGRGFSAAERIKAGYAL